MKNFYCHLARLAIKSYLENGKTILPPNNTPKELLKNKAGVFVSIHKKNPLPGEEDLRGCIGTFLPTKKNIAEEIIDNAISAATRDYRFPPVNLNELDDLEISVDILSKPEEIQKISSLDPKRYGVIVKSKDNRVGLLLPDLEGVNTPEEQIAICCQKAGIDSNESIMLCRFEVIRHKEK